MKENKIAVQGSERTPLGTRTGDLPANEIIEISMILKPRARPSPGERVSRKEFAEKYGARPESIARIEAFAKENDLKVDETSVARRTVKISGTVKALTDAFGVTLGAYQHGGISYRGRSGSVYIPKDLGEMVEAVLGFDNRPQARTHFRVLDRAATPAAVSYSPRQVAQFYDFPLESTGAGQTIGIIELGGGYKTTDIKNYFSGLGITEPSVTSVSVDKGKNSPTNANSSDAEVLLDIEVAGAVAFGAKIVVYFAPNTDQGFQDAITTAIHDTTHHPNVISISWGGPESTWTSQAMTAMDSAAQDAAPLGVTICAAAGDNGSSDGVTTGGNHVDFPASSPNVLACGGTTLKTSDGSITSETVWNDGTQGGATGGGFSTQFPLPSWQAAAGITGSGRGVPDVAGDADPQTGYKILVDGQSIVVGGTSAVAPLWSGLIALMNEELQKSLGLLQPDIYNLAGSSGAFHDITQGSNGAYSAGPGWDAASGLGSPDGTKLLEALQD